MSKHIKKFENEAAYNEFRASENYVKPNLSWCEEENTFKAESRPFNTITVTAEDDSITATAEKSVASTITIVLSGDINNTITIVSGQTIGTLNIDTSATVRTCNLSLSSDSDKTYSYVLKTMAVTIPSKHDYSQDYLTIISTSDNNEIGWAASNSSLTKTISISTDDGHTWANKTSTANGETLATLNIGDKLLVKGENTAYGNYNSYYNYFTSTDSFNVEGNIMSLIYEDNFINQTSLPGTYTFKELFYGTKVVDASNLILSATTLRQYCYSGMFIYCTSLTTAPALPATTLVYGCYNSMFNGCTALTTAPALPATTLANFCYDSMFQTCKSLTTAPDLPAATLVDYCYKQMFGGCTSLNYIKCLATNISASNCTANWVGAVAITGTFVKDPSMTGWPTGFAGIPSGWTVEDAS